MNHLQHAPRSCVRAFAETNNPDDACCIDKHSKSCALVGAAAAAAAPRRRCRWLLLAAQRDKPADAAHISDMSDSNARCCFRRLIRQLPVQLGKQRLIACL